MDVPWKRRKGRPKRMWVDSNNHDLTEQGLSGKEARDRHIKVGNDADEA